MTLPVINIAAYRFAPLTQLAELRTELRELAKAQHLRGTILLSPEGINLFVAGSREAIDALLDRIRQIPGLDDLPVKESESHEQPFRRMLVKIKREIIAFGVEGIEPARYTSPRVSATELKNWLDGGRPVTLLDTRNDYEVATGTFNNAITLPLDDFRNFPDAVARLPEELKDQPIVTFCTGGIRCEKAAPYLESAGFKHVFQLDGGILKYFEDVGGAHYHGDCFVFDQRVAVDPKLEQSNLKQCFACQAILSLEDYQSPHYVEGQSCPHCSQTPDESLAALIERRHAALRTVTTPLPGSIPYENICPLNISARFEGFQLLECLTAMKTRLSEDEWRQVLAAGHLTRNGQPLQREDRVRAGDRLLHAIPTTIEPDVATNIEILFEDEAIVVVDKPAPIPMHPCGRFNKNTLTSILNAVYAPLHPRPAHRLDADTTGVVVFSKSRDIARKLQPQFEAGHVAKRYLARVHGVPAATAFECDVPLSDVPGPEGVRQTDPDGKPAVTRFQSLRTLDDQTTLVEAIPTTGRTNQIRAHLWSLGLPIVGDPIYLPHATLGTAKSKSITDPPLCLHATSLTFNHPLNNHRVKFESPAPPWAE